MLRLPTLLAIAALASSPATSGAGPEAAAGGFLILAGSGQNATEERALTLPDALDAIARLRRARPMDAVTLTLPSGTIRLSATASITHVHAPSATTPLLIRGAADHSTRLVGSAPVALEALRAGDLPAGCCSALDAPATRRITLSGIAPDGGLDLAGQSSYRPGIVQRIEFYEQQRRLFPARWPKTGYATDISIIEPGDKRQGPVVSFPAERQAVLAREPALWIGGYWFRDWTYELAPVVSVTGEPPEAQFRAGRLFIPYPPAKSFRYFAANAYSALDEPGGYVIDAKADRAVLIPYHRDAATIDVARVATLLKIDGAEGVHVEDLAIEEALGTAVVIENATDIALRRLGVRNTGDSGIAIKGSSRVLVTDIVATHLGGAGVTIDAGVRRTLTPGQVTVRRSVFTHFGELSRAYSPGVEVRGVGNRVMGCYFADAPHSALIIYGNDHRIEDNEIENVVTETGDAGAIYFKGFDWTERGTVVRENFIHDIGPKAGAREGVYGIYLDGGLSGNSFSGNVFKRVARPMIIHGGRDNRIYRNLFEDPALSPVLIGGTTLTMRQEWNKGGVMRRALEAIPTQQPPWSGRYPELLTLPSSAFELPENNRFAGNIVTAPFPLVEFSTPAYAKLLREKGTLREAPQSPGLQRVERPRAADLDTLPYAAWVFTGTRP